MPGFDLNRFPNSSQIDAKCLLCAICHKILDYGLTNDCEHSFCKTCIEHQIEGQHKECPECQKPFSRKRTNKMRNNSNAVIVSGYVFRPDFTANGIINQLTINCKFQFNGCQEIIKVDKLSHHLNSCRYRFCSTCGLEIGGPEGHNCVQLLKNDRDDFVNKCDIFIRQRIAMKRLFRRERDDLKDEIMALTNQIVTLTNESDQLRIETAQCYHGQTIQTNERRMRELETQMQSIWETGKWTEKSTLITNYWNEQDYKWERWTDQCN